MTRRVSATYDDNFLAFAQLRFNVCCPVEDSAAFELIVEMDRRLVITHASRNHNCSGVQNRPVVQNQFVRSSIASQLNNCSGNGDFRSEFLRPLPLKIGLCANQNGERN